MTSPARFAPAGEHGPSTTPPAQVTPDRAPAPPARVVAFATVAVAALVVRPVLLRATSHPVGVLIVTFTAVGVGALLLAPRPVSPPWPSAALGRRVDAVVLAVGVGAFVAGRLVGGGHPPAGASVQLILLNTVAALAEEALFRRCLYDWIHRAGGTGWAVAGTAACFALVHVPIYGAGVLALDLAAGALLGWQRAATRSWRVPAVTHVLANLVVMW